MLNIGDITLLIPGFAAAAFLVMVSKVLRCESRALMLGVCLLLLAPVPASLVGAAVICLLLRALDLVKV